MTCKGICKKLKATLVPGEKRYGNGKKRCKHCDIQIYYTELRCPCCGYLLSSRPRNSKNKRKYLIEA